MLCTRARCFAGPSLMGGGHARNDPKTLRCKRSARLLVHFVKLNGDAECFLFCTRLFWYVHLSKESEYFYW